MSTREAGIALRRFGLGARPGEIKSIAGDARGFVAAQLERGDATLAGARLLASDRILVDLQQARREQKNVKEAAKELAKPTRQSGLAAGRGTPNEAGLPQGPDAGGAGTPVTPGRPPTQVAKTPTDTLIKPARMARDAFVTEVEARIDQSVHANAGFLERLVLFWSSHFAVSAAKGPVRAIVGSYEREAIRPHVLGRFADMLKATAQHPAMLLYLDNAQSIGPNSPAGHRRARGLNENLGRELLELHTLGVDGGYSQGDVTSLARLLTGWSVGTINQPATPAGRFFFAALRHEPGGASVLGRRYGQGGLAEGEAVLADLARHPATARHIARKLARHFVGDGVSPDLAARLERTFRETDGDLKAVARTLAASPEAWSATPAKIMPPYDYLVSLLRGLSPSQPALMVHRFAAALGQPTWTPPSPKGWPDEDDAWTGPAAIRERLRIAEMVARRIGAGADARALGPDLLGGLLGPVTAQAVARAETREQGIELLVMSPEFLRR